jgi:hypothetical protein
MPQRYPLPKRSPALPGNTSSDRYPVTHPLGGNGRGTETGHTPTTEALPVTRPCRWCRATLRACLVLHVNGGRPCCKACDHAPKEDDAE